MSKKNKPPRYESGLPAPVLTDDQVTLILEAARAADDVTTIALCEVALDQGVPHAMRACRSVLKNLSRKVCV
jgi:hypothetical protein